MKCAFPGPQQLRTLLLYFIWGHWKCRTWNWRTNVLGMKLQDMQRQSRKLAQKRQTSAYSSSTSTIVKDHSRLGLSHRLEHTRNSLIDVTPERVHQLQRWRRRPATSNGITCCNDWDDFHVSGDTGSSCRQLLRGVCSGNETASHLCRAATRVSALLVSTESSIFCPAISCLAFSCPAFSGCALLCPTHVVRHFHVLQLVPCILVLHFHVLQFHALQIPRKLFRQFHVLQFRVLQFWWSVIFMSCIFSQPWLTSKAVGAGRDISFLPSLMPIFLCCWMCSIDISGQCVAVKRSSVWRYSSDHYWSVSKQDHCHSCLLRSIQTIPRY